ncbi:CMRF35-like molecule 6 [Sorex araneus]|uniref:CMRF35-like molecule 6 n=1 Tax=Sorex araneus TaxID=42254 RepID=UPI002433F30B|nr:CMRF35-like molecule 6 [Sorex araneus]
MDGTVGGSLSVRCTYKQEDKNNSKFWCEFPCVTRLSKVVETSETQREARRGRVTIRDDPANLTFTVTLENLTETDAGTYWCGVSRPGAKRNPLARVVVSLYPAPKPTQEKSNTRMQTPPWATERTSVWFTPATRPGCLLGCAPFLLLILAKVPLLLGVLGSVLWGRRRPRGLQGAAPGSLA